MYFPADVSLRVTGDPAAAQRLFPAAKQLLFRALRMQETGGNVPVRLFQPGTDGSLVWVWLHQGLKLLYVQPGPVAVTKKPPVEEVSEEFELPTSCPDMLSGVVSPGSRVVVEEVASAHEFHPTQVVTNVYFIAYAWQDVERLAVTPDPKISTTDLQVRYPKPSMYSGAMKRVVQAVYGIGKTTITDGGNDTDYSAVNHYDYRWLRTDGLVRVGDQFWVVRIGKVEGVLAMPLPLFDCTTAPGFAEALNEVGDTGTYSIVHEFGGLPTGADFPEDLEAAITDGSVLRLLTKEDVRAFYTAFGSLFGADIAKGPLFADCGWAFSETGAEAHNTTFWYRNAALVLVPSPPISDYELLVADPAHPSAVVAPLDERAMRAEHWKIALTIVNRTDTVPAHGFATLSLVESGLLAGPPKSNTATEVPGFYMPSYVELLRVPSHGTDTRLVPFEYWGRPPSENAQRATYTDLDCPVFVFYRGNALEVVRHQSERRYANGFVAGTQTEFTSASGSGIPEGFKFIFAPKLDAYRWFWTVAFADGVLSAPDWYPTGEPPVMRVNQEGILYDAQFSMVRSEVSAIMLGPHGIHAPTAPFQWDRRWSLEWKRSGAFYSTSLDVRQNRRYGPQTNESDAGFSGEHPEYQVILDNADIWQQEVGVAIPSFVREGVGFLEWSASFRMTVLNPPTFTHAPSQLAQATLLSAGAATHPVLDPIDIGTWDVFKYATIFGFSGSINAGPTNCGVLQNTVYAEFYFPGIVDHILTPPLSFTGTAGGIDITGKPAVDVTYVGAV